MLADNHQRLLLIQIARISTFFIFIGRAYQHIFRDAPYRALLWSEDLLSGIVENLFHITWEEYVTDLTIADNIYLGIKVVGVFYLFCAIFTIFANISYKILGRLFLLGGAFGLTILALLYSKEKFFHVGQFFEYAIQILSPVILYLLLFTEVEIKRIRLLALIAIALTFSCHGLYAIGYYPRPGTFITMTMNILPLSEPSAHTLLKIAGIMDFVIAIGIFIPKTSFISLIYAFIWGLLTALARVVGHFYIDFLWDTIHQWLWEMIIRLPHGLIPLFVIVLDRKLIFKKRKILLLND